MSKFYKFEIKIKCILQNLILDKNKKKPIKYLKFIINVKNVFLLDYLSFCRN